MNKTFEEEIEAKGFLCPSVVIADGHIHRWRASGGASSRSGWYVIYKNADGDFGIFGDWRTGEKFYWSEKKLGKEKNEDQLARLPKASLKDQEELQKIIIDTINEIWDNALPLINNHPYLQNKNIIYREANQDYMRLTGDGRLIVPIRTLSGTLQGLQYISNDGEKKFHPGSKIKGNFLFLHALLSDKIYITEGLATGLTIQQVMNSNIAITFGTSNLLAATESIKNLNHGAEIIVCADNDIDSVGQIAAQKVKDQLGISYIMPPEFGDANDYYSRYGHLDFLNSKVNTINNWLIHIKDFCANRQSVDWLIDGWIPQKGLVMLYGKSGSGKSFIAVDLGLRIAAEVSIWHDASVAHGGVIYLAGEGHIGLRARIAAWMMMHKQNLKNYINFWVSATGTDLDTDIGLDKVITNISGLKSKIDLIIVDTLHSFMFGDENSSKDTRAMIQNCNILCKQFDCVIILVHHTGISLDAQHRARGSSAWRGALDVEIQVIPSDNDIIEIVQRKNKDLEIQPKKNICLKKVTLPDWQDSNGKEVTTCIIDFRETENNRTEESIKNGEPIKNEKKTKTQTFIKIIENAFWFGGGQFLEGYPYITKKTLTDYLISKLEYSIKSANQAVKSSDTARLVGSLLLSGFLELKLHGWIIKNETSILILKSQKEQQEKQQEQQK